MTDPVNRFYNSIDKSTNRDDRSLVGLFVYYLTVEAAAEAAVAKKIDECFTLCDLTPPKRTAAYLSEGLSDGIYVKAKVGYKLQRHYREELAKKLGANTRAVQTSAELRKLEGKIVSASSRGFLQETIDCFEAGANRATIVMCWILCLDHLIDFTMKHHLAAFNAVLAANMDKRVKVTNISTRDDFSEIPENKLIEFLKTSGAISKDVRKILDEKLGIRNSSAHPSAISIKQSKVVEFVEDLIENVVLKYQL